MPFGPPPEVTAFAPASVANLGPGFDILGLALTGAGDRVTARRAGAPGVRVVRVSGDGGRLSRDADANTAGIAAIATLKRAGVTDAGIELELDKGLPIGSGLGSSAASAAAAAFAVNQLLGAPLRKSELIEPCVEAEAAVSGRHADNVAAALLGGLILVRSLDPLDLVRLPVPDGLQVVVVSPEIEVSTRRAREVLPTEVPLGAAVRNAANLAALVAACHSGDLALLARCVTDEIVTPARAGLIPGCAAVIAAAVGAGALGSSISGSGPTIFALARSRRSAEEIGRAMQRAFSDHGLPSTVHVSAGESPGARRV